jgi:hypothetical protein
MLTIWVIYIRNVILFETEKMIFWSKKDNANIQHSLQFFFCNFTTRSPLVPHIIKLAQLN